MNRKYFPLFLLTTIMIGASAVYIGKPYFDVFLESMKPLEVVEVAAWLSGDIEGSLITVQYETNKNMTKAYKADEVYIQDPASNKKYGVLWVPKIGLLLSQSNGKRFGWFVIDNKFHEIKNGTNITVVIGEMRIENVTVRWQSGY